MKILKTTILLLSFFSYFFFTTDASASALSERSQLQSSDSISHTKVISYDKDYYSMNIYESGVTIPEYIWASSGSYAGYIPIKSWYISKTHYVVTYSGNLLKGPYAPTLIIEDIDNLEGETSHE